MKLPLVSLVVAGALAVSGCAATRMIAPGSAPSETTVPQAASTPTPASDESPAQRLVAIADAAGASTVHRVTAVGTGMFVELWVDSEAQTWYASSTVAPKRKPELETPVRPPGKGLAAGEFPLADLALVKDAAGTECSDLELLVETSLTPSGLPVTNADCMKDKRVRLAAAFNGQLNPRPTDFYSSDYLRRQLEFAHQASADGEVWTIFLGIDAPDEGTTLITATSLETAAGTCEYPGVDLPVVGHALTPTGQECDNEVIHHPRAKLAPFDPSLIDADTLAAKVAQARQDFGSEPIRLFMVAEMDGVLTLLSSNGTNKAEAYALV